MTSTCVCIKPWTIGHIEYNKGKQYYYTEKSYTTNEFPEGYFVNFFNNESLFFRKYQDPLSEKGFGMFSTYFKPIKDIRLEKLNKLEKMINSNKC